MKDIYLISYQYGPLYCVLALLKLAHSLNEYLLVLHLHNLNVALYSQILNNDEAYSFL